jgi:hypothetical protein
MNDKTKTLLKDIYTDIVIITICAFGIGVWIATGSYVYAVLQTFTISFVYMVEANLV